MKDSIWLSYNKGIFRKLRPYFGFLIYFLSSDLLSFEFQEWTLAVSKIERNYCARGYSQSNYLLAVKAILLKGETSYAHYNFSMADILERPDVVWEIILKFL